MSPTWLLSIFALIVITVGRVLGKDINVGDSFKFTTTETCGDGEMMLIRLLKTSTSPVPVARRERGVWKAEGVYKGRIKHDSASSFYLTSVNFNDEGLHEFTCAGSVIGRISLTVTIPYNIHTSEGQTISLPCHFSTEGKPVKHVRWELNGSLVLEQDRSSGEVRHGPGFERRASVALDWYLTGNMSMKLEQIKLEDQGEFICYAVDEDGTRKRGSPDAVKLRVDKRPSQNLFTTSLQPAESGATEERAMGAGVIFSIALNVVLFIAAAIFCSLWLRSRRSAPTPAPSTNGTVEEMTFFSGTGPSWSSH